MPLNRYFKWLSWYWRNTSSAFRGEGKNCCYFTALQNHDRHSVEERWVNWPTDLSYSGFTDILWDVFFGSHVLTTRLRSGKLWRRPKDNSFLIFHSWQAYFSNKNDSKASCTDKNGYGLKLVPHSCNKVRIMWIVPSATHSFIAM